MTANYVMISVAQIIGSAIEYRPSIGIVMHIGISGAFPFEFVAFSKHLVYSMCVLEHIHVHTYIIWIYYYDRTSATFGSIFPVSRLNILTGGLFQHTPFIRVSSMFSTSTVGPLYNITIDSAPIH